MSRRDRGLRGELRNRPKGLSGLWNRITRHFRFERKLLRLLVFDVGHGESLLLEFPGASEFAIIDCCKKDSQIHPGVLDYLLMKNKTHFGGIKVLFAALTHPDWDHFRGYAEVLRRLRSEEISVEWFWIPKITERWALALADHVIGSKGRPEAHREAAELLDLIDTTWDIPRRDLQCLPPEERWRLRENPKIEIEFLAPHNRMWEKEQLRVIFDDELLRRGIGREYGGGTGHNRISAGFQLHYGRLRLLLTGDMMNNSWELLLQEKRHDISTIILKVPHHGSIHSNFLNTQLNRALSNVVKTSEAEMLAVISGGYRAGLPHERTLRSLSEDGYTVFITGAPVQLTARDPTVRDPGIRDVVQRQFSDHFKLVREWPANCGNIAVDCYPDGSWRVTTESGQYS